MDRISVVFLGFYILMDGPKADRCIKHAQLLKMCSELNGKVTRNPFQTNIFLICPVGAVHHFFYSSAQNKYNNRQLCIDFIDFVYYYIITLQKT